MAETSLDSIDSPEPPDGAKESEGVVLAEGQKDAGAAAQPPTDTMALFMEDLPENPLEDENVEENPDLLAMRSLQEESHEERAEWLKEQGNISLKKGKRHYKEALDYYTQAIDEKSSIAANNSIYFANRAQVNFLRGNYGRSLQDSEEALKLNPANLKAIFRAARAAHKLGSLDVALRHCEEGLALDAGNEDLRKIQQEASARLDAEAARAQQASDAKAKAQALASAISQRGVKVGKATYKSHTGTAWLDGSGLLHWPVLLLYGEPMASDLIQDFCETDLFANHLDTISPSPPLPSSSSSSTAAAVFSILAAVWLPVACLMLAFEGRHGLPPVSHMFGEAAPPLAWDSERAYTRANVELYYETNAVRAYPAKKLWTTLVEDQRLFDLSELSLASRAGDDDVDENETPVDWSSKGEKRRVKVDPRATLSSVLSQPGHVLAGIPVFYVVAKGTQHRRLFLSGEWEPP
eukprot:jgi/Mesen1/7194/ME000371S06273